MSSAIMAATMPIMAPLADMLGVSRQVARLLVPCLDVRDGQVVKGVQFRDHRVMGEIVELAEASGTRVLGPNTMGTLNAFAGFSTAFLDLPRPADPPPLALVAQSGAFQAAPERFTGLLGKAIEKAEEYWLLSVQSPMYLEDDDKETEAGEQKAADTPG